MTGAVGSLRVAAVAGGTAVSVALDGAGDGAAGGGEMRVSGVSKGAGAAGGAGGGLSVGAGGTEGGVSRAPGPAGSTAGPPGVDVAGARCCIDGGTVGVSGNCRVSKPLKMMLSGFELAATWPRI